jgi:hypothetical protein
MFNLFMQFHSKRTRRIEMKFHRALIIVACLMFTGVQSVAAQQPSKKFKNCTELRKVYPNGVAKSAQAAGQTGAVVNPKIYSANASSDRDKDGIACEK